MSNPNLMLMTASLLAAFSVNAAVTGATGSTSTTNTGTSTGGSGTPMPTTSGSVSGLPALPNSMSMGAGAYTSSQLRDVQAALNRDVSAGLVIDGTLGPRTQDAIRRFQSSNSLAVTGELDAATIESMGLDFDATTDATRAPASVPNTDMNTVPPQTTPVR